ncbi:MAG: hypothetical protein NTW06_04575 [Candidatus Falkowbacteria bacterium]|nr:hypothetical protein [Candidatus Falkowbacteria bacterium]
MIKILNKFERKINGLAWTFISTGIILVLLAVLVVWTDFMLRLTCGMIILVVAYTFIYAGYKLWDFKKELKEFFNIKK